MGNKSKPLGISVCICIWWIDSRDGARQGQAIRELKRLDPGWDLLDWFEEVQDEIVPAVVHGYLEGDNELIDYYCFEQAYCFISCWSIKDILSFNCVNFISIYFIFYCTNLLVSFFFVSLGLVSPRDFCRALWSCHHGDAACCAICFCLPRCHMSF